MSQPLKTDFEMKNYLFLILIGYCFGEKQLWNDQADILLEYFSIGYRESNSTDLPIMDLMSDIVSISGVRLGDISTIKRLSDVILETKNGDSRLSGTFGLEKFELKVSNVRLNDYVGPAIIKSSNNSAEIAYTLKNADKPHSCRTKWEKFQLGDFSDLHVENGSKNSSEGLTEDFNKRILPALNYYFGSPKFLSTLSKTFDFCSFKRYLFPF